MSQTSSKNISRRKTGLTFRVVLAALCFALSILSLEASSSPTGFFIGGMSAEFSSFLGILFFVLGTALLPVETYNPRERVRTIAGLYERGGLGVVDAALQIDDAVGGIRHVRFSPGKKFTVYSARDGVPIPLKGEEGKSRKPTELAVALYEVGNLRHPGVRGELTLGRNASSKHHRAGLDALLHDFEQRHAEELRRVRQRVA